MKLEICLQIQISPRRRTAVTQTILEAEVASGDFGSGRLTKSRSGVKNTSGDRATRRRLRSGVTRWHASSSSSCDSTGLQTPLTEI